MRILIINDYTKPVGGAETFVHMLEKSFEKKGHKVELFGSSGKEDFSSFFSRWYSRKWYKKTIQKIKEFKPEVIHVNNCGRVLSPSVVDASLDSSIPVVLTFHDFYYLPEISFSPRTWIGAIKRKLHQIILKNKKITFVAGSDILAKKMEKMIGSNVKVIHNSIKLPRTKTTYQKKIIFVGELVEGKGLHIVADILNEIKNYKTLILGKGPLRASLEPKYKNLQFLGYQKPKEYYEKASIAIFPQTWVENLPYSVLETASYGLCVITSNIGALPELIKDMKTGILFESGNKKDFEKKLKYLIKNPKEIKKLGSNARKFVGKYFSSDNLLKSYEKVYTDAINKK